MVFKSNFVASIKSNGKILHEDRNETSPVVYLPFQSEYSILLKNLNTVKANVNISIDGIDILYGKSIIVNPNSEINIERFLDDMDAGHRFKFIEKTEQISNFRGDRIDDGIVRIEYQFEEIPQWTPRPPFVYDYKIPNYTVGAVYGCSSLLRNATYCSDGVTTYGSESSQKFEYGNIGKLEDTKHVITIMLRGKTANLNTVNEIVTSRQKVQCPMCGKYNRIHNKFCPECGSAVIIPR